LIRDGHCPGWVRPQVGSLLALPFDDETFDCVWCAKVVSYFTYADFARVVAEFRRVPKPGGTLAIKDYDSTTTLFLSMD
jgi:ubiquinone/menaquinone biosynthesis C-methylase UbiE